MRGLPIKAKVYWFFVFVLGVFVTGWQLKDLRLTSTLTWSWIILAFLDLFCEVYEISLLRGHATSAAIAVGAGAILIGGADIGVLVVLCGSLLAEIILRRSLWKKDILYGLTVAGFNVTQLLLSVALAGLLFEAIGGHPPPYSLADFGRAALAFLVYVTVNSGLVTGIVHFTTGTPYWRHLFSFFRSLHIQLLTLGVLAVLIAVVHSLSPWYVILMLSPLVVVQISIREYVRLQHQARQAFEKISQIVSARDRYTGVHSEQVAEIAVKLARALKLPQEEVERIEAAARVHDLGKIAIPDAILLKPGPLTEEEWKVVKKHPIVSAEILQGLEIYENCLDIIRHEHEHWDGSGYPDGLKGEEIPLGSRIIAVADVWNALLSDRPYRKAYSKEEARKIMQDMAGKTLDPKLVELFLKIVE
ncbi:MAG: HD-GYP domain-containing protein [Candidatus Bipolaricaulota bacterium]|nr:HD-GYP domain-containing protein [Candidatus Bipolaricaulota bacterium]MDW8126393.1 HD-GYP domain-containing protein [Candidatus Bipolaricaulota bacterium]